MVQSQHFEVPADAPGYVSDAVKDIGIREWVYKPGSRTKVSNPIVIRFVSKAIKPNDSRYVWDGSTIDTPWCAYYANAKLEFNNISGTKQGMARSFLMWGEKVDKDDDDALQVGDIVVIWRGSRNDGVTGHVFFLLSWDKTHVYGLGGNQGDAVSIQAFPRSKILGIRRPRGVTQSRTVRAGVGSATNELAVKPAVDAIIPEPSTMHGKLDAVAQAAEQVQSPLQQLAHYKPWIMGLLTAITVGLAIYGVYCRYSDHKEGFNT